MRTRSLSVSEHGGLTALDIPVSLGQSLILVNNHSKQKAECRVVSLRPGGNGKTIVGFAFLATPANFWNISFPPAGARPLRRSVPSEDKAIVDSSLAAKF